MAPNRIITRSPSLGMVPDLSGRSAGPCGRNEMAFPTMKIVGDPRAGTTRSESSGRRGRPGYLYDADRPSGLPASPISRKPFGRSIGPIGVRD
jgi:hypothetical protein